MKHCEDILENFSSFLSPIDIEITFIKKKIIFAIDFISNLLSEASFGKYEEIPRIQKAALLPCGNPYE